LRLIIRRTEKELQEQMVGKCSAPIFAQEEESGYEMKGNNEYVEIDLLSSYYKQDGDHAAVTGGIGTEELTDVSTLFVVNIPLSTTKSINLSTGC